jgi:AraC-like DNA-binding protein
MSMKNGVFEVQYSLLVEDAQLAASMGILLDEMSTPAPDFRIAQAQLLTLMLRIERDIRTRMPWLTDGLYSRFPEGVPAGLEAKLTDNPVIEKARQFIEFHLHETLTPAAIAAHVRMTPAQLNVIFRKSVGLSVMAYVTRMRIETAQLLLRTSSLSVLEIGHLVGFRQQAHFSRTFHSHVGSSPLKFRQRLQNESPRRAQ